MDVYVIDERYHRPWVIPPGALSIQVRPGTPLPEVVRQIRTRLREAGLQHHSVNRLVLAGHGNNGLQQLGSNITRHNAWVFRPLAHWRGRGGGSVALHGCGVASSTDIMPRGATACIPGTNARGEGQRLLQAMANALRQQVTGGVNCQNSDAAWAF